MRLFTLLFLTIIDAVAYELSVFQKRAPHIGAYGKYENQYQQYGYTQICVAALNTIIRLSSAMRVGLQINYNMHKSGIFCTIEEEHECVKETQHNIYNTCNVSSFLH